MIAVVLNWNGAANTLTCLDHLAAQTFASLDVVVVDNGSADDSVARIAARRSARCELLELPRNVGFAEGVNVGIRRALERGVEYVWLLNNDAFAEADCLAHLVAFMDDHPSTAMTTPRLLRPDGHEQAAGGCVDWSAGDPGPRKAEELTEPAVAGTWLTGAAPLARARSLQAAGLFDPAFFAYWEDLDLCMRLQAAGGDLRAVPAARALHFTSASTGGPSSSFFQFLMTRNAWLFLRKNAPRRRLPAAFLRFVAQSLQRGGHLLIQGHTAAAGGVVRGIAAAIGGRFGEPGLTTVPRFVTPIVLSHPWRVALLMLRLAALIDRDGGGRLSRGGAEGGPART